MHRRIPHFHDSSSECNPCPAHPAARPPRRCFPLTLLLGAGWAGAQSFNMITPAELKKRLESGDKPMLVDIQPEADYAQHHLPGALPTYAYPAKSEAERSKLLPTVRQILAGKDDVVIVCPAGGGGARNTYEFLKSQGVPESRMRILEKGQKGWPYAEMVTRSQ
jgi:rhodanese-related sulfurtransferase